MNSMIVLITAVFLFLVGLSWSKDTWVNLFVKAIFVLLGVLNFVFYLELRNLF